MFAPCNVFSPVLIREIPVEADSFELFPILFKHRDIPLPWRGVRGLHTDGVVIDTDGQGFFPLLGTPIRAAKT